MSAGRNAALAGLFLFCLLAPHGAAGQPADAKEACAASYEQGQASRREGKLVRAREELLSCARDPCPRAMQKDCVSWLEALEKELPSVLIKVRSQGKDVGSASVSVDDASPRRSTAARGSWIPARIAWSWKPPE